MAKQSINLKPNNLTNDKVVIGLITIFLIAFIGSNLDQLTGNLTLTNNGQIPIVKISPNEIKAGEKANVNIQVRGACVHPKVELYFGGVRYDGEVQSSGGRKAEITKKGRFKFCKGDYELDSDNSFTISYRTRPDWDGDYYARVYYWKDRDTKDFLHSYFKVRPKSK
ncbi:MAG: hypothetical protein CMH64_04260 [Nanoarchaeota archaeon]|nr:hypothetical protein [Nanoarchaeota archaeon]|tara:strand:+ start:979 stop:1479 length:501 start_codon:yes stop_codon:yes gene_type:complete